MTLEDEARQAMERELAVLRERFGEFPLAESQVENDPDHYEHGLDLVRETGMLADAGAWVTDESGRVLLIRHPGAPDEWGTPGGGYEARDESLVATAEREVREETGVDCEVTDVWRARRKIIEHRDEPRSFPMLTAEFEARGQDEPTAIDDEEVLEARWFEAPPERVPERYEDRISEWRRNS